MRRNKPIFINKNLFLRVDYFFIKRRTFNLPYYSVFTGNSIIPYTFLNKTMLVYNGKIWIKVRVNKYKLGFKFGEFTWNRKMTLKKNKKKKKKKKK